MVLYSFFIFNKKGKCVFYENHKSTTEMTPDISEKVKEDQNLLIGLLKTLKQFCAKIALEDHTNQFHYYSTDGYKLHSFDTATGVNFVAITDPQTQDLSDTLNQVYKTIYVPYVIKNPYYDTNAENIGYSLFCEQLNAFLKEKPFY